MMRAQTASLAPALLTLCLTGAMWLSSQGRQGAEGASAYHAAAAAAIGAIPARIGSWEGVDVAVPRAAEALLRPNALFSRRYVDAETGRRADLVIVQCRDTRDMAGHYPPVCYPAHGWRASGPGERRFVRVGSEALPAMEYEFAREEFDRSSRIAVLNLFVLPGRGVERDMPGVREAAADPRSRPFGAAQLQVVSGGDLPPDARDEMYAQLLEPVLPAIRALAARDPGGTHD